MTNTARSVKIQFVRSASPEGTSEYGGIAQLGAPANGGNPPRCRETTIQSKSPETLEIQWFPVIWGYSSAGRALEWHSRGQRFDPAYLHQKTCNASCGSFLLVRLQKTSQKSSSKIVPFAYYLHSAKDATIRSNESHALGRASNGSTKIF